MAVYKVGTDNNETLSAPETDIAGSVFDGKGGQDVLQLMGSTSGPYALKFDFTLANLLTGFETIRGTDTTDYITLNGSQLASIQTFESGGSNYWDYIEIKGNTVDLRNKAISGSDFRSITLLTDDATVTVNSKPVAMLLNGSKVANEHLVLENILLTVEEKQTLHDKGIDRITDQSGVTSIDIAPQLAGILGDQVTVSVGQTVHLDVGQNASISEDRRLAKLSVSLADWTHEGDKVGIDPAAGFKFIKGTFEDKVIFNEIEIGTLRRSDTFNTLDFVFNAQGTADLAQKLIRALTYEYNGSKYSDDFNTVKVVVADTGGREAASSFSIQYSNPSTTPPEDQPVSDPIDSPRYLFGGASADILVGSGSKEILYGRGGKDVLTGGAGQDIFGFDTKLSKANLDRITDFNVKDDTIWLDNKIMPKLGKGSPSKPGTLNKKFFVIGPKAKDKDDYLVYDNKKGVLFYDADGSGAKAGMAITTLSKKLKMTAADFFVI